MAGDDNVLKVQIQLDDGTVRQGFAKIEAEGKSTFRNISETALGVFAGNILSGALTSIKNEVLGLFKEATAQASSFDLSLQKLNSALSLSGKLTEGSSRTYQDLADKIQRTTSFSDDTVIAVETLAATYAKTNAQALKLTQASIDFAAATGTDANEAALKLSQTLQGTTGRLTRLFPELKQYTAAQLEAGAAVDFFAKKFAGAAVNQVDTFAGRVAQLKNNFDDLLKTFGQSTTRSPAVLKLLEVMNELVGSLTDALIKASGQGDIFKPIIIGFAGLTDASIEAGRQIGYSLELGFLRAKQAFYGLQVVVTLGLKDSLNEALLETNNAVAEVKAAMDQPSAANTFFDQLILKIQETSGTVKQFVGEDLKNLNQSAPLENFKSGLLEAFGPPQVEIYKLSEAFFFMKQGFLQAANEINITAVKTFKDRGAAAIKEFSNAVTSGFSAIGQALVKGQDIFKAFAGAFLSAIGAALVAEGGARILQGIARAFGSYGLDPTAQGLIATGSAMTVAGGALQALGSGGVTGVSNPSTSVSTGGGSAIDTGGTTSTGSAATIDSQRTAGVVVNIQGSVFDTQETGLRIVDLINDNFNSNGARILAT